MARGTAGSADKNETVVDPSYDIEKYIVTGEKESPAAAPKAPKETAAAKRARELREQLAHEQQAAAERQAAAPTLPNGKPVPEAQLDPEQREVRILEDRLAQQQARAYEQSNELAPIPENSATILFHVLVDGFTAFGVTWMRGQEIEVVKGSPEYELTVDRNGKSWLDFLADKKGQYERWGELKIDSGPWYGQKYKDRVADADAHRGRSVPRVTF